MKKIGIISYGFYIPRYRIRIQDIARVWGKDYTDIEKSLGVIEKTVASTTEDSVTMGYEASSMAIKQISNRQIDAVFFGSESPPYAVNPSSTILAEFLNLGNTYLAYDTQFACKAGTGALISAYSMIKGDEAKQILVCSSDKATAKPHDALEYTAASGAASFLIGMKDPLCTIDAWTSYSSDTPDFWRREGIRYPSHGGRFSGKPSYFAHIIGAVTNLLHKTKLSVESFAYVVFHMPNGRFPVQVAKQLGCTQKQLEHSLVVTYLGNTYTASGLMGLISTLEFAKPGEKILFASYGSGAGSDAFVLTVTKHIEKKRIMFHKQIEQKEYIDYPTYLKYMQML